MSTISLPKFERVSFRNPQLAEVVCQLRFSPVLRIISEMPSQFQDLLRREYPTLSQEHGLQIHVGAEQAAVSPAPSQAWHFGSADGKWIVALAPNFVTLKTTAYTTFDEFYERLRTVQEHLEAVYEPGLYGRVGLRYVNRFILPRDAEHTRVAWEDILNPTIASPFAEPVLADGVIESQHYLVLRTDDGNVGVRFARDVGKLEDGTAERFTLDFDHFATGQINPAAVESMLRRFRETLYNLFRWSLTEQGFTLLEPVLEVQGDKDE